MINPKDIIYIHIREGIPASGKTFTATNEIANTANTYWYFSHSNQTIDGIMLRFIELGLKKDIDFRVIRGINYKAKDMGEDVYCGGCLRYVGKDKRDLYLKHLIELNTPASMVCRICAYYDKQLKDIDKNYEPFEKSCLYRKQFKNYPRIVLSVINYMNTKYVDDSERDYLILDDVTSKGGTSLECIWSESCGCYPSAGACVQALQHGLIYHSGSCTSIGESKTVHTQSHISCEGGGWKRGGGDC